jgi:gliding motility-associated-like protein
LCKQTEEVLIVVESDRFEIDGRLEYCSVEQPIVSLSAFLPDAEITWEPQVVTGNYYETNEEKRVSAYAESSFGCKYSASVELVDNCESRIFAPNTFTPNNDGHNEEFTPSLSFAADAVFKIFNRWGQEIFSSKKTENLAWNGVCEGEPCVIGVYVWEVTYTPMSQNEKMVERGVVNLIR